MKLVHTTNWRDKHSLNQRAFWAGAGKKIRIEVHRDFYDHQSYARAHMFDQEHNRWNMVWEIPEPELASLGASVHDPDIQWDLFSKDSDTLYEHVLWLLESDARPKGDAYAGELGYAIEDFWKLAEGDDRIDAMGRLIGWLGDDPEGRLDILQKELAP